MKRVFKICLSLTFLIIILAVIAIYFKSPEVSKKPNTDIKDYVKISKNVYDYCKIYENSNCELFFKGPNITICEQSLMLIDAVLTKDSKKCDIYPHQFQCKVLIDLDYDFCMGNANSLEEKKQCDFIEFMKNPDKISQTKKENWDSLYFWAALWHKEISLCSNIPKTDLFSIKSEGICKTLLTEDISHCIEYYK